MPACVWICGCTGEITCCQGLTNLEVEVWKKERKFRSYLSRVVTSAALCFLTHWTERSSVVCLSLYVEVLGTWALRWQLVVGVLFLHLEVVKNSSVSLPEVNNDRSYNLHMTISKNPQTLEIESRNKRLRGRIPYLTLKWYGMRTGRWLWGAKESRHRLKHGESTFYRHLGYRCQHGCLQRN